MPLRTQLGSNWRPDGHTLLRGQSRNNQTEDVPVGRIFREIHEAIRSELLKFEVDLESLEVAMTTIKVKYNWSDLFANIGGTLSLYSGISIITQAEIIQLFCDLLIQLWLKTRGGQSSTRVESKIRDCERLDEENHRRFSFRRDNTVLQIQKD